jgi:glycosyltransferase involved in cell wall biosynthesis
VDGPLVAEVSELGYETTVFGATRLSDVGNYLATVIKVRAWIRRNHMDAVLSWMSKGHFYVGLAALGLRIKTSWFQHSVPVGSAHMDRLITMLPAAAVLCCSSTSKSSQDRLFPRRQSYICYPGVMMQGEREVSQVLAREQLGLPVASPVIGMVARLERWKGAHVFVEAAQDLLKHVPEITLFIVGGPHASDLQYAEEVATMVKRLDCGKRFLLAGQRPMEEALLWQAAADIIVHPVTGIEPFGMAVVEAMAQGKVVVSSNHGGPAEVIQDQVNGILIRSGDPEALASTLVLLLQQPDKRYQIEQQATVRGRSFSIPAFVTRFEEILYELLTRE